jgi:polyhydroxybutyrate depolymerase
MRPLAVAIALAALWLAPVATAEPVLSATTPSAPLTGSSPPSGPPSSTVGPCEIASQPGSSTIKISSGGLAREAVLHVPSTTAGHRLPLLIALHGYGGTGARFEHDTGFSTLADKDGFAVLYPSSHGPEWAIHGTDRDVDFIADLLERVSTQTCIDGQRIYATGVSNGGRMAALLGCALSSRIAAIAPVAGGYKTLPTCAPERPVSVLEIHGTDDTTVPYEGSGPQHEGAVLPYMFAWAARDGCQLQPTKRRIALHTLRYQWSGCRGGSAVEQLRIYGGKHGLPDASGAEISSGGPYTISGVQQVWHFLAPITLAPANSADLQHGVEPSATS